MEWFYQAFGVTPAEVLSMQFAGIVIERYLLAIGTFFAIWILLKIVVRKILLVRLRVLAERTKTDFDDKLVTICDNISPFFFSFLSFYLMLKVLQFDGVFEKYLDAAFMILVIYEVIKAGVEFLDYALTKTSTKKNSTVIHGVKLVIKIVIWAIGFLLILSNLGFDITALAASMGIGGIAIALAAQNILSDLFASFTIYFDRPFDIGDFIVVGNDKGEIKKIGLKTTRIQTLQGEELVISNRELTETRIQNFKKMQKRRVAFSLGVEYGTPTKKLKKIPDMIQKIIESEELATFNRAHFASFGDFSLNFDIVYYVTSNDYVVFMDTQEDMNLQIKDAFEKEKIEMAFPTQTIYVKK